MIKLVQCVSRRPHLQVDDFRDAWERYAELLRSTAVEMGAVRVTVSTNLETPLNEALMEARGSNPPFDGIAEIAWRSGSEIFAAGALPGARERIAKLRAAQERFVDPSRSSFFFVHEQQILAVDE